jgi:hypothetical protein
MHQCAMGGHEHPPIPDVIVMRHAPVLKFAPWKLLQPGCALGPLNLHTSLHAACCAWKLAVYHENWDRPRIAAP